MAELFVLALLGHLVGDYMLQTKTMALKKSQAGWVGAGWCALHVAIYTASVAMFWGTVHFLTLILVFAPHYVMDRWSLASWWLKLIRGRTFEGVLISFRTALESENKLGIFDVAFTCLVYAVVDNTFHLLSLWVVIKYVLMKGE